MKNGTAYRSALIALIILALMAGGCASAASSTSSTGTSASSRQSTRPAGTEGGRYALVVGNAEYQNIEKLANTINDAKAVAGALEGLGFEVDIKLNAGEMQFGAALDSYVQKLSANPNNEGFFWYAGHGIQIGDRNYLLPVDASVESERTLQRDAYSLDELLAELEGAGNKVNVVIVDACRNNPLPSSSRGAGGTRGLAAIQDVPGDLFVMFSTAAGDVADDGKGRKNSPFAEAFLKYIDSGQPLALMSSDVINETMRLTDNAQRPFVRGSIVSEKNYSLNPGGMTVYTAEEQAQNFYKEGMLRFNSGEWDGAILYFTEAIRAKLNSRDVYFYRALANGKKNNYDRAIADYSEAIDRNPNDAVAHTNRGLMYSLKGNYDRAIQDLDRAIWLDSKYALAYRYRGFTYNNKGDYEKSIADLTKALGLDPRDATAYNNRGWAYIQKRDYDKAIADLTEVLRLDPKYTLAYENRGYAYNRKGDYDRAITDLTEAIRLGPTYVSAYYERGFAYNEKGDYNRAITDLTEAIRLNPKYALAYNSRGYTYNEKGEYDRAIADLTEALRLDPKFTTAYVNRGYAYRKKGDYDRAIADYTEALRLNPNLEAAKNGLEIAKKRGKP